MHTWTLAHLYVNFSYHVFLQQLIWQKLYKTSQEDYGSLNSLFAHIGWFKAKKPKVDMHTYQDALLTVFKGCIVAAA